MDAGRNDAGLDPIEVLLAEHGTILQVLDRVERESRRLEQAGLLREAFWHDVLRFHDEFDARLHHGKEEGLLFPVLEQNGWRPDAGPTAILRDEHRRAAHLRERLDGALRSRDRSRLAAAAAGYLDHQRAHLLKENQLLFPLARRLLSREQLMELRPGFDGLLADRRIGAWLRDYDGSLGC
jgi:hemerythrin-like domain-containing protein